MILFLVVEIAKLCIKFELPFVIENPETSFMWEHPLILELTLAPIFAVTIDQCGYGMRWKKPTRLLTNVEALKTLESRCQGTNCRCSFTKQPHITLRGRVPVGQPDFELEAGQNWTKVACPYPKELSGTALPQMTFNPERQNA